MANIDNPAAEMAEEGFFRIALGVEYKGSRYSGWQRQANGVLTVQETLENALSKVAASPVSLMCAGRTDAGVHACGQVVHFDTQADRSLKAWVMGANINLPHDISVSWAKVMPADFHARFKAIARRYRYVIYNDQIRPAHLNQEITWNHRPLDVERMAEAAQYLLGVHDFSAFRAGQCQAKSPIKEMHHLRVTRHGRMIVLDIRASAFLHHMVRNLVGSLVYVGQGKHPPCWMEELLLAKDRAHAAPTFAAAGLYLIGVVYEPRWGLPNAFGSDFLQPGIDVVF